MITLSVVLPHAHTGSQESHLRRVGSVVRIEEGGHSTGYAITCDFESMEETLGNTD
jgi:hypothetical protein